MEVVESGFDYEVEYDSDSDNDRKVIFGIEELLDDIWVDIVVMKI